MAKVKNLLRHVLLEDAERKRKCHHNSAHEILKGMKCLVVVDARGSKQNYCPKCAKPMLDDAWRKLAEFGVGLGLGATD